MWRLRDFLTAGPRRILNPLRICLSIDKCRYFIRWQIWYTIGPITAPVFLTSNFLFIHHGCKRLGQELSLVDRCVLVLIKENQTVASGKFVPQRREGPQHASGNRHLVRKLDNSEFPLASQISINDVQCRAAHTKRITSSTQLSPVC